VVFSTQEQWSPDQISGRLAKDGVAFISHERIYQHVWKDKKDGGALHLHLRHSGKKYNKRKGLLFQAFQHRAWRRSVRSRLD
jgi:IS30 family transposase